MIRGAFLLVLHITLFGFSSTVFGSEVVHVTSKKEVLTIGLNTEMVTLEGEERTLGVEAVSSEAFQHRFHPCQKEVFTAPPNYDATWIKFDIKQSIGKDIWLHIESAHMRELDFYLFDEKNNLINDLKTGAARPESNKIIDVNTFYFPLQDRTNQGVYTCYIRATSGISLELPLRIGTMEALSQQDNFARAMVNAFLGLMLIMFFYNGFLYVMIKESIYLLYTIHLFLAMVSSLYISNYLVPESIISNLVLHDSFAFWVSANYISTNVFSIYYLKLKTNLRWAYSLLVYTIPAFVVIAVLGLIFPIEMIIPGQVLSVFCGLTILGVSYYLLFTKKAPNVAFAIGYSFGIFAVIIIGGVLEGWLPYTPILRNILLIGVPLEVLLFSIGLGERFNALRKGELELNSNLKRFNLELEASNESLDQFNYHVSHDLKTVLNNTHSLGMMIRKYNAKHDHEKIENVVDRLLQTAESGSETVDSFLSLSGTNVGRLSSDTESIHVKNEIKTLLKKHGLEGRVAIHFKQIDFDRLSMNRQLFESLFMNLISNSIKYCNQSPVVEIDLLQDAKNFIVRFRDNGVGIDLEKYGDLLFQPFRRLLNKEGARGSGVGLHLVQKIIQSYQGTIGVASKVNEGTIFTMVFPKQ